MFLEKKIPKNTKVTVFLIFFVVEKNIVFVFFSVFLDFDSLLGGIFIFKNKWTPPHY